MGFFCTSEDMHKQTYFFHHLSGAQVKNWFSQHRHSQMSVVSSGWKRQRWRDIHWSLSGKNSFILISKRWQEGDEGLRWISFPYGLTIRSICVLYYCALILHVISLTNHILGLFFSNFSLSELTLLSLTHFPVLCFLFVQCFTSFYIKLLLLLNIEELVCVWSETCFCFPNKSDLIGF